MLTPLLVSGGWFKLEGIFGGKVPCAEAFNKELNDIYVLDINDCSNKVARYYDALVEAGYTARVAVVTPNIREPHMQHVVVEVNGKFYDPTNGDINITNINHFGRFEYWIDETELQYHWEFIRDKQLAIFHHSVRNQEE